MTITVELPEDLRQHQNAGREALEAFAIAGYRIGALSPRTTWELLGFTTRYELDGFLKQHQVFDRAYGEKEYEQDMALNERECQASLSK